MCYFLSFQADQICYAVLCVFSYVAAGMEQQQQQRRQTWLTATICFWNNDLVIMCQRKSFFFKSLILHEIMKFLKISFFCTENFWPKISAAILIWGYNSTWKLKNIVYKLPHFANLQVAQRRILTIAPKFIYIFPSPSQ